MEQACGKNLKRFGYRDDLTWMHNFNAKMCDVAVKVAQRADYLEKACQWINHVAEIVR